MLSMATTLALSDELNCTGISDSTDHVSSVEEETDLEREAKDRQREHVLGMIDRCLERRLPTLDLSRKHLTEIPDGVFLLDHLEGLYLEGNDLDTIPGSLFEHLPSLQWLDLRNNSITSLPSTFLGRHPALRTILLQGNHISHLPLELGLIPTLEGLSLSENPLVYPTNEIIGKGTRELLSFLRQMVQSKSSLSFGGGGRTSHEEHPIGDGPFESPRRDGKQNRRPRPSSAASDGSDVTGTSLTLHRLASYQELKQSRMEKIKKAGAMGRPGRPNRSMSLNREFPVDTIDQKLHEQQSLHQLKMRNQRVEAILQKRRNEEERQNFKRESKRLQHKKDHEKYVNGGIDFVEPVQQSPYDINAENIKVMTNEERIKEGVRASHERVRRVLSPAAVKRLEAEKAQEDRELTKKVRDHAHAMKERRKKKVKGSAQDEMINALRDLEIAKRLRQELDKRRKDLEYRLQVFNPPP